MRHHTDWLLAIGAGIVLAVMIHLNGALAAHTSALFAAWFAHGLGAAAALVLVAAASRLSAGAAAPWPAKAAPLWAYAGGFPGALTVVLAAITVNNGLSLSGTLALMLVGQVAFGMVSDGFGLFGLERRRPGTTDLLGVAAILSGSVMLLLAGA